VFPDDKVIRQFIVKKYRQNALVGKLFLTLLSLDTNLAIEYSKLPELDDIPFLLLELEKHPIQEPVFVEISDFPVDNQPVLGVWIYCADLVGGGFVYEIALINETHFPQELSYMEIRASHKNPFPMFGVLEKDGFVEYDLSNYPDTVKVGLRTLKYALINEHQPFIHLSELNRHKNSIDGTKWAPPQDPKYIYLLKLVIEGQSICSEADIPLASITPLNIDFCLSIPEKPVNYVSSLIESGQLPKLLVYCEDVDKFILSDDYIAYLAYRKLGHHTVPTVILGGFQSSRAKVYKSGGAELLPPLTTAPGRNLSALPVFVKEWLLERKLIGKQPVSPQILNLYSIIFQLSTLIQSSNTNERELHEFLKANPLALDSYGCHMLSEVRLGDKYRIDLILQYSLDDKRILLIELERSDYVLFTKSGRPREKITHAIQQVEDWLRWWQENPTKLPAHLDGSIHPDGLVVVGRSHNLDDDTKKRLLHLNHNRRVKVITYDDLLERLNNLIENIEAMQ